MNRGYLYNPSKKKMEDKIAAKYYLDNENPLDLGNTWP